MRHLLAHRVPQLGVLLIIVAACGDSSDDTGRPSADRSAQATGEQQDSGAPEGRRSFDPSDLDRTCAVDTDCALVDPVVDCESCCASSQAVRNTPALNATLAEISCETRWVCTMHCTDVAVCVNGTCEKKPAPTDGGADGG